jgi:hypothetical protein
MQPTSREGPVDPGVAHPKAAKLRPRYDALLAIREGGKAPAQIGVPFVRYADIRRTDAALAPVSSGKMRA